MSTVTETKSVCACNHENMIGLDPTKHVLINMSGVIVVIPRKRILELDLNSCIQRDYYKKAGASKCGCVVLAYSDIDPHIIPHLIRLIATGKMTVLSDLAIENDVRLQCDKMGLDTGTSRHIIDTLSGWRLSLEDNTLLHEFVTNHFPPTLELKKTRGNALFAAFIMSEAMNNFVIGDNGQTKAQLQCHFLANPTATMANQPPESSWISRYGTKQLQSNSDKRENGEHKESTDESNDGVLTELLVRFKQFTREKCEKHNIKIPDWMDSIRLNHDKDSSVELSAIIQVQAEKGTGLLDFDLTKAINEINQRDTEQFLREIVNVRKGVVQFWTDNYHRISNLLFSNPSSRGKLNQLIFQHHHIRSGFIQTSYNCHIKMVQTYCTSDFPIPVNQRLCKVSPKKETVSFKKAAISMVGYAPVEKPVLLSCKSPRTFKILTLCIDVSNNIIFDHVGEAYQNAIESFGPEDKNDGGQRSV